MLIPGSGYHSTSRERCGIQLYRLPTFKDRSDDRWGKEVQSDNTADPGIVDAFLTSEFGNRGFAVFQSRPPFSGLHQQVNQGLVDLFDASARPDRRDQGDRQQVAFRPCPRRPVPLLLPAP